MENIVYNEFNELLSKLSKFQHKCADILEIQSKSFNVIVSCPVGGLIVWVSEE